MAPVPINGLFEAHLTVSDLGRSIEFYRDVVGLELAHQSLRGMPSVARMLAKSTAVPPTASASVAAVTGSDDVWVKDWQPFADATE